MVQRPPGVEGFLPIGALMGWKHFLLTGNWEIVHPATMVILGYGVLLSFFLQKFLMPVSLPLWRPLGTFFYDKSLTNLSL